MLTTLFGGYYIYGGNRMGRLFFISICLIFKKRRNGLANLRDAWS
jgi:hypothetical protein